MKRFACLLLACLLLLALPCARAETAGPRYGQVFDVSGDAGLLTVRFLWLGPQIADDKPGDCMILTSPDGQVMVLDAGHPLATAYVTQALDAMGITRIDYLVASHPHIDHIGGFPTLLSRYEVGAIYTSALTYDASSYYQAYMACMQEKGLKHIILAEGDSFSFGGQVRVDVYNPAREIDYYEGYPKSGTRFINNHSLALKFTYGESTLLLCGDLYSAGERELVDKWGAALDCDVLKANHHGASTSSCPAWRKAVTPKITIVTSDVIEDTDVLNKAIRDGQKVYHTLLDGCIRLSTPGDATYAILTEKDRTTSLYD